MSKAPKRNLYFIDSYVRCGAMPLYLIFYKNRFGDKGMYAMLCTMRKLRALLKERKGFSDPKQYGKIIYKSYESFPTEVLRYILKSRYDFDVDQLAANGESRLF